jgi:hypothetical protein
MVEERTKQLKAAMRKIELTYVVAVFLSIPEETWGKIRAEATRYRSKQWPSSTENLTLKAVRG